MIIWRESEGGVFLPRPFKMIRGPKHPHYVTSGCSDMIEAGIELRKECESMSVTHNDDLAAFISRSMIRNSSSNRQSPHAQ